MSSSRVPGEPEDAAKLFQLVMDRNSVHIGCSQNFRASSGSPERVALSQAVARSLRQLASVALPALERFRAWR